MKNIKKLIGLLISLTVIFACVSVLVSANGPLPSAEASDTEADAVICTECNGNGFIITKICTLDSDGNTFTSTCEAKECPIESCCHGIIG